MRSVLCSSDALLLAHHRDIEDALANGNVAIHRWRVANCTGPHSDFSRVKNIFTLGLFSGIVTALNQEVS